MAEVKLKEELELWEPAEVDNSVVSQMNTDMGREGVQSHHEHSHSLALIKEEPVEFSIKQEPLQEFPFIRVIVKSEDESTVLHQTPTEENRAETNGAEPGLDKHSDRDGQTEDSSDTDDSDDWTSTETSTEQIKREPDEGAVGDSDCGKTFRFTTGSNGTVRVFECSLCPLDFKQESDLRIHMRSHTGPFSCWICKNTFTDERSLQSHIRSHTGEKPCHCFTCHSRFRRYSFLKTHMLTHSEEKPFSCSVCKKTFAQQSQLGAHMVSHSEHRLFTCSVCERTFSQKLKLSAHMKVHKERIRHKCPVCDKIVMYLDKHMLKNHTKKPSLFQPKPLPNHRNPVQILLSPVQTLFNPVQICIKPVQVQLEPVQVQLEPVQVQLEPVQVQLEPVEIQLKPVLNPTKACSIPPKPI